MWFDLCGDSVHDFFFTWSGLGLFKIIRWLCLFTWFCSNFQVGERVWYLIPWRMTVAYKVVVRRRVYVCVSLVILVFCFTCLIQSRLYRSAQSKDFSFSLFRFVMDWAAGRSAHCFDFFSFLSVQFFFFFFMSLWCLSALIAASLLPPVGNIYVCMGRSMLANTQDS